MAEGIRCDRCGTVVAAGRVICPTCDNVVDLSFLGDATRADFDDDDDVGPFSPPTHHGRLDAPVDDDPDDIVTARVKPKLPPPPPPEAFNEWGEKTSPSVRRSRDASVKEVPVTPAPHAPPGVGNDGAEVPGIEPGSFLIEATEADFDDMGSLLKSSTDALILGDPSDIVESLWVEDTLTRPLDALSPPPVAGDGGDAQQNFLTDATVDGTRDVIPVQVYVGADIARVIEPDAVLERVPNTKAALSTFEEYVLAQIDGLRPVARIQTRMGLGAGDLRIALALLVDKKLVRRVGRAAPASPTASPTPSPDGARAAPPPLAASPRTGPVTAELPSVPRPPTRHVAGPSATLPPVPLPESALSPIDTPADVDDNRTAPVARPLPPLPGAAAAPQPPLTPLPGFSAPGPREAREAPEPTEVAAARAPVTTSLHELKTMQFPASPSLPPQLSSVGAPAPTPPPPALGPPSPTPAPGVVAAPRTGLVVNDAGRSRAAALYAQCLRDLKNGAVARAFAVARMAHDAAPDEPLYKSVLDNWNAFVDEHRTADDARLHAQAVSAESAGDPVRAVALLRQAVQANPSNAGAWNRLGLLLATRLKDVDGALDAMTRAIELAPNDATFKNNFGKIAALADRGGPPGGGGDKRGGLLKRIFGR